MFNAYGMEHRGQALYMIFRILVFIVFLAVVVLVVVPFALYLAGINIFPSNPVAVSVLQKTGVTIPQRLGILIRSQDRGDHWQNASVSESPTHSFPSAIYSFAFHPQNPDIMYLGGAATGLWTTINGGRTWNRMSDANGILDAAADIYDIKIARANPQIFYIAAYEKNHGRILKSDDNGVHFHELYATSADKKAVFTIVVDPADANHLLAATGEGALIETSNGGQTWRIKKMFSQPLVRLIANPQHARELYLINADGGIIKSVTGGNDWSDAIGKSSQSNDIIPRYPTSIFDFLGSSSKGSQTIFLLDPTNASRIYSGSDKTLLRSEDAGLTWKEINLLFPKELLPITALAVDPHTASTIFVAAAQELHKSVDDGITWRNVPLPAGISIKKLIIHPQDSRIMFAIVGR